MSELYRSPLRVFILLGMLGLWGIVSGLSLPISLFPNSSKPIISVEIPFGSLAPDEFAKSYGNSLEYQIKSILIDGKGVDVITSEYEDDKVQFLAEFQWGVDGQQALKDVTTIVASMSSSWPEESRSAYTVNFASNNSGFLAISFFSQTRSLNDLSDELTPLIDPMYSKIQDAADLGLYNPFSKVVEIRIDPERAASLHILPSDVERSIRNANNALSGGKIKVGEKRVSIQFPRGITEVEELRSLPIVGRSGAEVKMMDIADIEVLRDPKNFRVFKTSGVPSLVLFATPKSGGNIKRMSDEILKEIESLKPRMGPDIEYKVLVNPSEFIDSSIRSVTKEVALAALLAVAVLMLFIGSFKNVATAAIEIPLSIIMAFIFMKFFGMNLNLISLGGLALSAGMNVDASVVVMENIFRHFDKAGSSLNFDQRLKILTKAVREVWAPIIASTIASLVVFIPLILTSGLTNAILGDLAKAVIFSHSMSAVVALLLVPTVRLLMMKNETSFHVKSPIEKQFAWLENKYVDLLRIFIEKKRVRWASYASIALVLGLLVAFVLPTLPREIIGRPETDWLIMGFRVPSFSNPRQMESFADKVEFDMLKKFESSASYTFTQINGPNHGWIMLRLKNRKYMKEVWKQLEEEYVNTPSVSYSVVPWNPSELRLPNPADVKWELLGGSESDRIRVAEELRVLLSESQIFPRVSTTPESELGNQISIRPYFDVLSKMKNPITISELADFSRIGTDGKYLGSVKVGTKMYGMRLEMENGRVKDTEQLSSLPIGLGNKIVPFGALAHIAFERQEPSMYRVNYVNVTLVEARENASGKEKENLKAKREKAAALLENWQNNRKPSKVSVAAAEADKELSEALEQLKWALALSVLLIFVTMVVQFGDVMSALLVLIAIPLGLIGVIASLFVFKSTLSLNSVLGMILLNGIAVANSIILVDFLKKLVESGQKPAEAAINACRARLRPILMTSLTTILGMLPIALGFGEGGRILQPLGIAVAGGLWISMLLTVFVVPALQVSYLNSKARFK